MKKYLVILLALLMAPTALAQIPWEVSDQRCGNKALDDFELCDKNASYARCDALGEVLKVATACDTQHCTCLPRVNKAFCGNNNREGIEVCDGNGEDKCAEFGALINISLACNPKTCGCSLNQSLPADYNPVTVEALANASLKTVKCGDKKVERDEECDPPNTLCTTYRKEAGVCTDKCRCIPPDMLGREDEITAPVNLTNTNNITVATTNETNTTLTNTSGLLAPSEDDTEEPETPDEDGFFTRLLKWIANIFS